MKKYVLTIILLISIISVSAIKFNFSINLNKIFSKDNRTNSVNNSLDTTYAIEYDIDNKVNKEYENITKEVTYLLLGDKDNTKESVEDYLKRKKDYLKLMYDPDVPKDKNDPTGLDTSSQEYEDSLFAGITIPSMFLKFDDLNIRYTNFGDINIIETDDGFISRINIPNVLMDDVSPDNPREYKTVRTNLTIYYIFKKYNKEYKLYYVLGETDDSIDEYLTAKKTEESKGILNSKAPNINDMSSLYDYSNLDNLTNEDLNNIYNNNANKIMIINTYYDKAVINSASGFMLTNNVLVTSWSSLKYSLINGQFIEIRNNNNIYPLDGIITVDEKSDIALLKISDYQGNGVILGTGDDIKVEDAVISIGTKTGIRLSTTTGIVISNTNSIQSLIPISSSDVGGPLLNTKGEVIGINNNLSVNSSVSYATKIDFLKDIKEKLIKDNDIKVVSFEKMKENYYYNRNNEENIKNDISDKIWSEYSKIGNIEESILLPIIKSSYKNNILSIRYKNEISDIFSNDYFIEIYINNLKKDGYKEVVNNTNKKIYENNKYEIIIMKEFDYIIVVMVKK